MDSLERVRETAADWVARRHGEDWTPTDEAELARWMEASIDHRVEYLGHEKSWRDANRLKLLGAGARPGLRPTIEDWRSSPYFKHAQTNDTAPAVAATGVSAIHSGAKARAKASAKSSAKASAMVRAKAGGKRPPAMARVLGLAAAVLFACVTGYWFWNNLGGERYSTSIGITTAVPLPDGSKITLNTASQVRVAVNDRERKVELEQGEAFFEVVPDANRPFTVQAGGKRVVVLGTKFSVRRDRDEVRVVVTEGKVGVSSAGRGAQRRYAPASDLVLEAGTVASAKGEEKFAIQPRAPAQAEELLSWREGYLMFDEVTLAEAVAEFNRYNARKFVVKDASIASIPVTGHFRSTSVEPFARLLEEGFPVVVMREEGRIVLGARPD